MRGLPLALRVRDFRLLLIASLMEGIGLQMMELAIGWEVYSQHRSALDLGWIGLAEFVPMFVLALPAGHLADHLPRRLVLACSLALGAAVGVGLALVSAAGVTSVLPYLALAVGAGISMALGQPSAGALPPTLVPVNLLAGAMTLTSSVYQGAMVVGPALGGVLYGVSPRLTYLLGAGGCLLGAALVLALHPAAAANVVEPDDPGNGDGDGDGVKGVLEGLRLVRGTPILLGAILLDLLAVLFGGAVALLPIFARSILHVGAAGLGVLRAAPAVGAILAGVVLTRRPIAGRAGRLLLIVVGLWGATILVFGLSRTFWLSVVALAAGGFVDLFSMTIRGTTVALATPDRLRGRVNAVEMMFLSASNQLGAFESGLAAFLVGTIPAVLGGGAITVLLALSWARLFPALAQVDRLEDITPVEQPRAAAPVAG